MEDRWYETVSGAALAQGDVFAQYPIFVPTVTPELIQRVLNGEKPEIGLKRVTNNVIVLSQSCDLANDKIDTVLVCPIWNLKEVAKLGSNEKQRAKRNEEIRRGHEPALHMLNKPPGANQDFKLVEFTRIYTTPKGAMQAFVAQCGPRLRLLPPYREHLSQAFARYFMRVGLPTDIPKFD